MTVKVGINGFGRIGRLVFRTIKQRYPNADIEVVAVNDLFDPETNAHLLKYDSTYGHYNGTVGVKDGHLVVDGKTITVSAERDPGAIKWKDAGVDIVIEFDRFLHGWHQGCCPHPSGWCEESHYLGPCQERRHHNCARRQ